MKHSAYLELANNMFGKLKPDIIKRINKYIKNPIVCGWDDIHCIIISGNRGMKTIWQAVIDVDPFFPIVGRSEDLEGNILKDWEEIPTAETVIKEINNCVLKNELQNSFKLNNMKHSKTNTKNKAPQSVGQSKNIKTEIGQHDVSWYVDEDGVKELTEIEIERIGDLIRDGYSQGQINMTLPDGEYETTGWWSIVDWKSIALELYHQTPNNTEAGKKARKLFDENWD